MKKSNNFKFLFTDFLLVFVNQFTALVFHLCTYFGKKLYNTILMNDSDFVYLLKHNLLMDFKICFGTFTKFTNCLGI